jgi:hypothetical protein
MTSSSAWASSHAVSRSFARGQAALKRLGPDGQAAATFAAQTAPRAVRGQDVAGVSADSSFSAVGKALSGDGGGGMGFPLPALLIASLLAAVGYSAWGVSQRARAG